jgi:nicotinamidase-related amidase
MPEMESTALLINDLQNDFLHPRGAYGRAGLANPDIMQLPARLAPLVRAIRNKGGWIVATQFTLVAGRNGDPLISPHLQVLRPFLTRGDFCPGAWGHRIVDELQPIDLTVEKIAYSAFYMTRLEWLLRRCGISRLIACGIVTNGGVASTVRDAHVRDFECVVLEDGCASFSPPIHEIAIAALRPICRVGNIGEMMREIE